VHRASTFTGFCAHHDSIGFAPLETKRFEPTREQLALLAYRALCRETYAKRAQLRAIGALREGDRGAQLSYQVAFQELISTYGRGVQIGLSTLDHHKRRFEGMLARSEWTELRSYVVEFDTVPDVLLSGFIFPEADFAGNCVQKLQHIERADGLAVSSIATDRGGAVVFSWMADNSASESFILALRQLRSVDKPHFLVRYMFECFENICISPTWWEQLEEGVREGFIDRMNNATGMSEELNVQGLLDDGVRAVSWNVVGCRDFAAA
jgi:hypothetical protein